MDRSTTHRPNRPLPMHRTLEVLTRLVLKLDGWLGESKLKIPLIAFFVTSLLLSGGLYVLSPWYEFIVNRSDSLPGTVYWLDKTRTPKCGDTTVLTMPGDARFFRGSRLIKIIKGCAGDRVSTSGREVFVNNRSLGKAKPRSTLGNHVLTVASATVIPINHVYLHAPHSHSYDSRYVSFGLREISELLGTATRIY